MRYKRKTFTLWRHKAIAWKWFIFEVQQQRYFSPLRLFLFPVVCRWKVNRYPTGKKNVWGLLYFGPIEIYKSNCYLSTTIRLLFWRAGFVWHYN